MKAEKILELLNNGEIELLKKLITEEVYKTTLDKKAGAKERYAAMKKYFTNKNEQREFLKMPCFQNGKTYFTDSYSAVITTERAGEMAHYDTEKGSYINIDGLFKDFDNRTDGKIIDIIKAIAEAKSKGYKYKINKKQEDKSYLIIDGNFYDIDLIVKTFEIINDGAEATLFLSKAKFPIMYLYNNVGKCLVMPINPKGLDTDGKIIIKADQYIK